MWRISDSSAIDVAVGLLLFSSECFMDQPPTPPPVECIIYGTGGSFNSSCDIKRNQFGGKWGKVLLTLLLDVDTVLDLRSTFLASQQLLLHLALGQLRCTVSVGVHFTYPAPQSLACVS